MNSTPLQMKAFIKLAIKNNVTRCQTLIYNKTVVIIENKKIAEEDTSQNKTGNIVTIISGFYTAHGRRRC
nr:hypothetical protein Itr_chr07CG17880 [Ipomoea trifida]GMD16786.1 hypothetical protein Iba_chr07cCG12770 [Ipomoea batatas]